MSVIETVKRKVGLEAQNPQYECEDCGRRFRSGADEGSYWFDCPDCGSEELRKVEST
jgi:predicted RNA-binding Zn-ribbon protein involved in translation (DUF1610 family)